MMNGNQYPCCHVVNTLSPGEPYTIVGIESLCMVDLR